MRKNAHAITKVVHLRWKHRDSLVNVGVSLISVIKRSVLFVYLLFICIHHIIILKVYNKLKGLIHIRWQVLLCLQVCVCFKI